MVAGVGEAVEDSGEGVNRLDSSLILVTTATCNYMVMLPTIRRRQPKSAHGGRNHDVSKRFVGSQAPFFGLKESLIDMISSLSRSSTERPDVLSAAREIRVSRFAKQLAC